MPHIIDSSSCFYTTLIRLSGGLGCCWQCRESFLLENTKCSCGVERPCIYTQMCGRDMGCSTHASQITYIKLKQEPARG